MVSFYLDADVDPTVASHISASGVMAVTARIMGTLGEPDYVHLRLAAEREWTLVTHNGRDFSFLHRIWCNWPLRIAHAGILTLPHSDPMDVAADVLRFAQQRLPHQNRLYHRGARGGWALTPL